MTGNDKTGKPAMTEQPTPKGAWKITFLLFLFMLVNFADKIVVGLAGDPIMKELQLSPQQFGELGSSFFLLFSITAIIVGFIVNRIDTRWVLLVLALVWALAQFPMVGAVGFTTLLICRIILGAGEGPAFSVAAHAIYKWFPDEKRTLPTAILSQGSAFGVILAVPALNWLIVHYDWHYAFAALGIVGLMWVVAWLILGKEGPLVQTAAQAADEPRIPYFQLLTSRTFIGCVAATFGAYWALSLGLTWFTPFIVRGLGFSQQQAGWISILPWVFGATIVLLTGWISQVMLSRGYTSRGARGVLGAVPLLIGGLILSVIPFVSGAGLQIAPARGRVRIVRIDLCGLPADDRRVHAGVAARRGHFNLQRNLHAGRHSRADGDGKRDPACGGAARRLHDRLHHQCRHSGRLGIAWPCAALAQHRACAVEGESKRYSRNSREAVANAPVVPAFAGQHLGLSSDRGPND